MYSHGSKFKSSQGKGPHFLLQLLLPQIGAARCVPLRRWLLRVRIPVSNLLFLDKVSSLHSDLTLFICSTLNGVVQLLLWASAGLLPD